MALAIVLLLRPEVSVIKLKISTVSLNMILIYSVVRRAFKYHTSAKSPGYIPRSHWMVTSSKGARIQ